MQSPESFKAHSEAWVAISGQRAGGGRVGVHEMTIITESMFQERLRECLKGVRCDSVIGPGRSGAIASVYASHLLKVPWLPQGITEIPLYLYPVLVIDTARQSGRTLRKLAKQVGSDLMIWCFEEPPRVKFWYEREALMQRTPPTRSLGR